MLAHQQHYHTNQKQQQGYPPDGIALCVVAQGKGHCKPEHCECYPCHLEPEWRQVAEIIRQVDYCHQDYKAQEPVLGFHFTTI